MPGKQKIFLNPGDALLFHAWEIHRGIYDVNKPRRTFDIIYGWGNHCDYYVPPITCFGQSDLLDKLSLNARDFFSYFIQTYSISHTDEVQNLLVLGGRWSGGRW